ncbi:Uroporphyrinogen-III synthase [Favolaschia claudopus]|uniref:Uroporphyrinogen-III synthase n=1 Tax=Favolaschia claudopus TaxID=2862362 RepID=A0AAW0C1S2_9AGAR
MPNVLLLRAPSESPDRYEAAFSVAKYAVSSVPVLETVFVNSKALADVVGSESQYRGVIITSGRASEAWATAVANLESEQFGSDAHFWSTTPFYVVGKSTASVLMAIQTAHPNSPLCPVDIRGDSSGTSEQLAKFILGDLDTLPPSSEQKPFLYLTGDKNRDTLPKILQDADVELSALQVYQTQGSSTFSDDLDVILNSSSTQDPDIWWIVFFAPSAAEFVLPVLRRRFRLDSDILPCFTSTLRATRVASIGPTTSVFLQEKLSIRVDAMASKPAPESLLLAIETHDKVHCKNVASP